MNFQHYNTPGVHSAAASTTMPNPISQRGKAPLRMGQVAAARREWSHPVGVPAAAGCRRAQPAPACSGDCAVGCSLVRAAHRSQGAVCVYVSVPLAVDVRLFIVQVGIARAGWHVPARGAGAAAGRAAGSSPNWRSRPPCGALLPLEYPNFSAQIITRMAIATCVP